MRSPAIVALLVAACSGAPPPSRPPAPPTPISNVSIPGQPEPTARVAGWDALVIGARAFVVAAGFDAIEAYEPASGRRLWRAALPEKTSGRHSLHALGGSVVLWAGDRMFALDAATGKLVRKPDDAPWSHRCWLHTERGMCAITCECDVRVVDCATGKAIGKTYEQSYVELFDMDGEGSGGCHGGGGDVVGRAGTTAVLSIEDREHLTGPSTFTGPLAFIGVALPSGRELYRVTAAPLTSTVAPASTGTTADGRTCFAGDHNGRFTAWDCATGAPLWSRPEVPWPRALPGHLVQASTTPRGIFRRAGDTAALHDERTGAVRWTRTIPASRVTLLAGAPSPAMLSLGLPSDTAPTEIVWLGVDGAEVATAPLDGSIHPSDDGGVFVLGAALVAYDTGGGEVARTTEPLPRNLTVAADHVDVFGDDLAVLDRALRVRVRVGGSAASAPGSTLASLAIYRWPPKGSDGPGEILLYSLPARP